MADNTKSQNQTTPATPATTQTAATTEAAAEQERLAARDRADRRQEEVDRLERDRLETASSSAPTRNVRSTEETLAELARIDAGRARARGADQTAAARAEQDREKHERYRRERAGLPAASPDDPEHVKVRDEAEMRRAEEVESYRAKLIREAAAQARYPQGTAPTR